MTTKNTKKCPYCGREYEPVLVRPEGDTRKIQEIFPDSEPWQREQVISGCCSDECWYRWRETEGRNP